jgi:hypothetical protein
MKRFTVKDFIAYNNPCFSCDSKINFNIGFLDLSAKTDASYLRPTVFPDYTEVVLKITYSDSLRLFIFHRTNKILTDNNQALTKYLDSHKLFLSSTCGTCLTQIESQYLEFNLQKKFIAAVGLNTERLIVGDGYQVFQIHSYHLANKSKLTVDSSKSSVQLDLPILPLYKFKNKKHFLEKIKTYLIFS